MGLLGARIPKKRFSADFPAANFESRLSTEKWHFWILWTQETHFAPSNVSISHFATILRSAEYLEKYYFDRYFRKSATYGIWISARNFDQKFLIQNFWGITWRPIWGTLRTKIQLPRTKIAMSNLVGATAFLSHFSWHLQISVEISESATPQKFLPVTLFENSKRQVLLEKKIRSFGPKAADMVT